jgi:hypothetical protein
MKTYTIIAALAVASLLLITACDDTVRLTQPVLDEADPETVIFFEDFDDENDGEGVNNWTDFQQWNVITGCVDLHGNGFNDVVPGRGLYVDMDGTCNRAGTIETKETFTLVPGDRYLLEYWLAGNQRRDAPDSLDVTLGGAFQQRHVLPRREDFKLHSHMITVADTTQARLRFRHYGNDNEGALLDLIRMRRIVD